MSIKEKLIEHKNLKLRAITDFKMVSLLIVMDIKFDDYIVTDKNDRKHFLFLYDLNKNEKINEIFNNLVNDKLNVSVYKLFSAMERIKDIINNG